MKQTPDSNFAITTAINTNRRDIKPDELILKIDNLKVSFQKNKKLIHIVRGVDLEIKKGEIIGLVGESGSGKTVTTKSLLNINRGATTTADYAMIDNIDINKLKNFRSIRGKKVGYIPQDPMTSLNPTRKIYKQILDVIKIHRPELNDSKAQLEFIVNILERFGIRNAEKKMHAFPHSFSGGMKQRVVIAMVVAAKPDLIVADEPTTALDATVQAAVLELFTEIKKEENISMIFISHNISVVAKLCDYIYVMYAGKIVEQANKKELFINPVHPYT
jgi:oligopeptide transport system ATP-binding protein